MNAEQDTFNKNTFKNVLGGIREIGILKYIILQVQSVWQDWWAIADVLFVYKMTADLHAGEIPCQSYRRTIWR